MDEWQGWHQGRTFFFTVRLAGSQPSLLTAHIKLLNEVIEQIRGRLPFYDNASVVLPDHLHAIWTLPHGDTAYAKRWHLIKSGFARRLPPLANSTLPSAGHRGIWQRRYRVHRIRDDADYRWHLDYLHYNPVRHGYVKQVIDWPCSSFHRYVAAGLMPADWNGTEEAEGEIKAPDSSGDAL